MLNADAPYITYAIMALTIILSWQANNDASFKQKLIFYPYAVKRRGEFYRFLTGGLIHADWLHLGMNMYVLYLFGASAEFYFIAKFGSLGWVLYPLMYLMAIPIAETYSYLKHHDNGYYMSLGASGAVSAVVFASILFDPLWPIGFIFLPEDLYPPGFIMGTLYLIYSHVMAERARDNIGHNAHFYGALFGLIFPALFKPKLFMHFLDQIQQWLSNL